MRAALYHRVSTTDQNPDTARQALQQAAQQRGWEVVLSVEETGSGAKRDRPGLRRIMEAAHSAAIDALLVWKLDRFGRSSLDVQTNIHALKNAGVRFICVTQALDISPANDPMSNLMLSMLAAFAEFELELIRERTLAGMARAKKQGKRFGRPCKGKRPNPEHVKNLRGAGKSWKEISERLGCTPTAARRAIGEG